MILTRAGAGSETTPRPRQLSLLDRPPFCPGVHCHVPCGVGIGVLCTCPPHRCRFCAPSARRIRRRLTADVVFRGPLPRPLFTYRLTPTKEASPR